MKKRVGSYEILKPLATGGMAEVFLARSTSHFTRGKIYALKRTLPDFLDSPELCQMFLDEIRVGATLNHQNIVQVCDFGQTENQAFLVMEYIQGLPLRELIGTLRDSEEHFPLPFVLYIIKKIGDALEYAHNAEDPSTGRPMQLIHRDISPQNIMLTYEGEIKVIDFGIAKAASLSGQTQHGTIKGKLAYMSPEQALREPLDNRTDLFSLGILFWELLANRRFFAGKTPDEVKNQIREYRIHGIDFSENESLRMLEPILRRMLHHEKERRYSRAKDLCQDLQLFLNKNYPAFSHLELAVYLKNLFSAKYERSLRDLKNLLSDEHTKTDRLILVSEKTEKTLITKTMEILRLPPLQVSPTVRIRKIPLIQNTEPTIKFSSVLMGLLLVSGLGSAAFFGHQWHKSISYKALLAKIAPPRDAFATDYIEVQFSTPADPAQIRVNGQLQVNQTPIKMRLLKNRPYQIEVFSPDHRPRRFSYIPSKEHQYYVNMERLPVSVPKLPSLANTPKKRSIASVPAKKAKTKAVRKRTPLKHK